MSGMCITRLPDLMAGIISEHAESANSMRPILAPIRTSLEGLRDGLLDLARRIERPILEVGAFLESIQDLESAKPSTQGGTRLVVALQSYDMFHQEIQLAEQLIELLSMAMKDSALNGPALPGAAMLANAESICFHLDSARTLIENAASEIPPAISQVLHGAGVSPQKFQNWAINRSLAEIGVLTSQLGNTTAEVDELTRTLAVALGEDPNEKHGVAPPEAVYENSSVMLF